MTRNACLLRGPRGQGPGPGLIINGHLACGCPGEMWAGDQSLDTTPCCHPAQGGPWSAPLPSTSEDISSLQPPRTLTASSPTQCRRVPGPGSTQLGKSEAGGSCSSPTVQLLWHHRGQDGKRAEECLFRRRRLTMGARGQGEAYFSGRGQIWWQDAGMGAVSIGDRNPRPELMGFRLGTF